MNLRPTVSKLFLVRLIQANKPESFKSVNSPKTDKFSNV